MKGKRVIPLNVNRLKTPVKKQRQYLLSAENGTFPTQMTLLPAGLPVPLLLSLSWGPSITTTHRLLVCYPGSGSFSEIDALSE